MAKPQSFDRLLWKAADQIHDRLNPQELSLTDLLSPETPWRYWQICLRRIGKAQDCNWAAAVEIVRQEALQTLTELSDRLEGCRNVLAPGRDRPVVASVGEIYCDLVSLRDEFP